MTPDGEGVIEDFEIQPTRSSRTPTYHLHHAPNTPLPGEYIRCGVNGCHPYLKTAYYPLDEISQDPQL